MKNGMLRMLSPFRDFMPDKWRKIKTECAPSMKSQASGFGFRGAGLGFGVSGFGFSVGGRVRCRCLLAVACDTGRGAREARAGMAWRSTASRRPT